MLACDIRYQRQDTLMLYAIDFTSCKKILFDV